MKSFPEMRRIMNISEIAELANVSRATVSRYLNGGYVSAQKKEQIKKVIEETGYTPLNSAQALRSRKTNYIGVIIPKINSDSISRMVAGISHVLADHNYQLLLACTNNDEKEELKYLTLFKENHVDGIILLGTIFTSEHRPALERLSIPVVILGQYLAGYSCIYPDDYHAAKELTASLSANASVWGLIAANKKDQAVGLNRLNGFLDALSEQNMVIQKECMTESDFSFEGGYAAAKRLLAKQSRIDSLICATDTIAAGAMAYLHETGRVIPGDIQIAGFGDSALSNATFPPLTTVHFHYHTAGKEAAKTILELIEQPEEAVTKELKLGYKLMIKGSSR